MSFLQQEATSLGTREVSPAGCGEPMSIAAQVFDAGITGHVPHGCSKLAPSATHTQPHLGASRVVIAPSTQGPIHIRRRPLPDGIGSHQPGRRWMDSPTPPERSE
jgi:hypothetical protein